MPGSQAIAFIYPARITRFGIASRQGTGQFGTDVKDNLLPGMAFFIE